MKNVASVEVIKAVTNTKENGKNIYEMMNASLKNYRSILALNKEYKEKDRDENAWRTVEQFLIVFLWTKRDQAIGRTFFFASFAKNFIIQITWNVIIYHWHVSPAINYGKVPVLFFFKNISRTHVLFLFLLICSW